MHCCNEPRGRDKRKEYVTLEGGVLIFSKYGSRPAVRLYASCTKLLNADISSSFVAFVRISVNASMGVSGRPVS